MKTKENKLPEVNSTSQMSNVKPPKKEVDLVAGKLADAVLYYRTLSEMYAERIKILEDKYFEKYAGFFTLCITKKINKVYKRTRMLNPNKNTYEDILVKDLVKKSNCFNNKLRIDEEGGIQVFIETKDLYAPTEYYIRKS
jgi:hypothetical protein